MQEEREMTDDRGPQTDDQPTALNKQEPSSPAVDGQPSSVILYDADANQRIPFSREEDGFLYDVVYVMGPQKDGALIEYDRRCDRRLFAADEHETGERNALESIDKSFEAAVWLAKDRLVDVDGFGEPGEVKPENWKELIGTDSDLAAIVDQAYLAADIAPVPPAKLGQRLGWKKATPVNEVIRVRALFEGHQLILSHERRAPVSPDEIKTLSEVIATFKSIMKQRWLVEGTRTGKGETRIPPKAEALGAVYDRLGYQTTGYKGRVPLHHKQLVVIHDLSKEADAVRKK